MRKIKAMILIIISMVFINIAYAFFLFDYDKKTTIELFTLYLVPEDVKTPTNIITREVSSLMALKELRKRDSNQKMIEEIVGFTILARNRNGYSERAYDRAINFLDYLRKKGANFSYGKPCSVVQASLFMIIEGKFGIREDKQLLEMLNLKLYLLDEESLSSKDKHADKAYCHQSINEYLRNPLIESVLKSANIDDIIADLQRLE